MRKSLSRRGRRKNEPSAPNMELNKEQRFFGAATEGGFFAASGEVQRETKSEDEEKIQRQEEEEEAEAETVVQASPEEDMEGR